MRIMSATDASRAFASVLDDAERGETIVITRGGQRVAIISPAAPQTWGALRAVLADRTPGADPQLERDLSSVRDQLGADGDPWQSA